VGFIFAYQKLKKTNISYRPTKRKLMNSWLIISGGAKKALIKRIITYTTLRYIKKKCGDIISYSRSIQKIPGNCIIKNM
jgi:hypothetical protein